MKKIATLVTLLLLCLSGSRAADAVDNGTFTNPVLNADVPDISVCRVGNDFYMVSTTMHLMPGAPIMKSKDLVNWEIVGYVFDRGLDDTPNYDLLDGKSVYGRGQWATSIRYHNGKFYVMFATNDPHAGYIYSATDPAGKWERVAKLPQFHDPSLFFDDDGRVYVFYGTGEIQELKSDLSGVKPDGLKGKTFVRGADERGLLEGSSVFKHNGKYYLCMISMPRLRREVCYRADSITGPWEKKVILETPFETYGGVGQGCVFDGPDGRWYGMMFQDRGGVGRVPCLMPCRWVDGWPMLGDENGQVQKVAPKPIPGFGPVKPIVTSDEFTGQRLDLDWQWNHNPIDAAWSLKDRPGFLRLTTARVVHSLFQAPNTLSQRMEGPRCSGSIRIDVSKMKNGDVAGFAAFNGHSGVLSIVMEGGKKYLTQSAQVITLESSTKNIRDVAIEEKARIPLKKKTVFLRIDADFNPGKDLATFYYSFDNKKWIPFGSEFKMRFDYQKLFMGTRFAIFNYATQSTGGSVDIDFFHYQRLNP
jgi:beta-xylosidase